MARSMLRIYLCLSIMLLAFLLAACAGGGNTAVQPTRVRATPTTELATAPSPTSAAPVAATEVPAAPTEAAPAATEVPAAPTEAAPAATEVPVVAPPSANSSFAYGMGQPIATLAELQSEEQLTATFRDIKALGINMLVQVFPAQATPDDWKRFLDVAQQEGLLVMGKLGPIPWNPDPNDLSPIMNMLAVVGDHPALYAFQYLHEPWEVLTTPQMQQIYQTIKASHPNLRLGVSWSGEIGISQRRPQATRTFTDGLCDVCLVNLKAFQNNPGFAQQQGLGRIQESADVIRVADPDAELWSSAQVWAPTEDKNNPRGFRIPTADEMQDLFCSVKETYSLEGFFWETWTFDKPTEGTLSQPEASGNKQRVRAIYEACVLGSP